MATQQIVPISTTPQLNTPQLNTPQSNTATLTNVTVPTQGPLEPSSPFPYSSNGQHGQHEQSGQIDGGQIGGERSSRENDHKRYQGGDQGGDRSEQSNQAQPSPAVSFNLTSREQDVLIFLAQGFSNNQIGGELHLSPRTIEKYVSRLLQKTDTRNRSELLRFAMDHHLVDA
ncbi:MAG: response regulator transcription factor [Merismopedia sp. SIO2A8]|nr:response regulator transcription factor [Symploca sp. SIO2B6]NET51764.1 response regulator transcription factor [Merismopedia sp. SIO2A8]